MSRTEANGKSSVNAPSKQRYASSTTPDILEILWRRTYSGHGLTTREIHDALMQRLGEDAPSLRTVSNQLNALEGRTFLGREIHKLDPKTNEEDAGEIEGAADPQLGWRMSTFFEPSEARLLADGLALSRISRDSIYDIVAKLNELVGGISIGNDYLTTTSAKDDFSGEFLRTIGLLNEAITHRHSAMFNYTNYDAKGQLRPRLEDSTGKPRRYHVDPYQMVFKNGRYYLVCALHDKATQRRIFCIDRIINLRVTDIPLNAARLKFDAITYMRERPYPVTDEPVTIVMTVPPEAFNPLFEWFDSPKIVGPNSSNRYQVTVRSPIKAAYWWTLQYADIAIDIRKPEELREQLATTGCKFAVRYGFIKHPNTARHDDGDSAGATKQ
ncbi:helix-turn-helix transcriptional regulator [Bifidobacterium saguinibicoloris]|uniref:helix-turn-helix transcriptional regulator n=1 Tax=Bifidobacterium saguinibicoloris TaxID=2834433 RepID=UPI001C56B4CB|nr:WYL domain-containing protein [Bifidobacterium saguinibicoloris]MBW3081740.1 WYL domain-containing protein [Bifidobacterium saguinibicoloris]